MTLIEDFNKDGLNVKFYRDIDFDILIKHPKDGSSGFIYCFIDNWVKEVKKYNRENKLKSIIDNSKYEDFNWESINNNYICVYQSDGVSIDVLYDTIREKFIRENNLLKSTYIPINGLKGGWKIEIDKINN